MWARSDVIACICSTPICLKLKNLNSVAIVICTWEIPGFEANSKKRSWIVKLLSRIDGVFSRKRLWKCVINQYFYSVLLSMQVWLIVALSVHLKKYSTWATISRIALLLIRKYEIDLHEFREKIWKNQFKVAKPFL